jgi:hypothetical protein
MNSVAIEGSPSSYKENLYSLESFFLKDFDKDSFSLETYLDISTTYFSFVLLKGLLQKNLFHKKADLHLSTNLKAKLIKKGYVDKMNLFYNTDLNLDLVKTASQENFEIFEPEQFHLLEKKSGKNIYTGAGILREQMEIKTFILYLYSRFNLKKETGNLFLRNSNSSFLYPIGGSKIKTIFIQNRPRLEIPFLFYHIKLENPTES